MKPYQKQNFNLSIIVIGLLMIIGISTVNLVNHIKLRIVVQDQISELMVKQPVIGKAFKNHEVDAKAFITCIKTSKTISPDNTIRCLAETSTLKGQ